MTREELLEAVERVTDGDGDLDWLVTQWADPDAIRYSSAHLPYSTSIDAALGLVERLLPGFDFELRHEVGRSWDAILQKWDVDLMIDYFEATKRTAPLAILAALLKAMTNKIDKGEREDGSASDPS